jgi:hypothetical protein
MDFDRFPHPIDVIGIAAGESVERSPVVGIDDEKAADGRFAIVCDQRAGGDYADPLFSRLVQMDSVLAIEFGACSQNSFFVDSVNYELQREPPSRRGEDSEIAILTSICGTPARLLEG